MPTEEEVKNNGIELGSMNAKLLEKIEELTLYILQQQKEIKLQSMKIETQNKNFDSMQKEINKLQNLYIKKNK